LTDLKTKEAVDDNGDAERGASRAEIRRCFVGVLKIRRHEMKQTCDYSIIYELWNNETACRYVTRGIRWGGLFRAVP
jgi:hypothetical protein